MTCESIDIIDIIYFTLGTGTYEFNERSYRILGKPFGAVLHHM